MEPLRRLQWAGLRHWLASALLLFSVTPGNVLPHTAKTQATPSETARLYSELINAIVDGDLPRIRQLEATIDRVVSGEARRSWRMFERTIAAETHLAAGEYSAALDAAQEARRLLTEDPVARQTSQATVTLTTLGRVLLEFNEPAQALVALEEGHALADDILTAAADPGDVLSARFQLRKLYAQKAAAHLALGQVDAADTALARARELAALIGFSEFEFDFSHDIARLTALVAMRRAGDTVAARDRAFRALLARGDDAGAWLVRLAGPINAAEAGRFRRQMRPLFSQAPPRDRIQLHVAAARAFARIGDSSGSLDQYLEAVRLIEESRLQARQTSFVKSFFAPQVAAYEELALTLHDRAARNEPFDPRVGHLGATYAEAALHVAEAARAREFADRYGRRLVDSFGVAARLPSDVLVRERELREAMAVASGPALELFATRGFEAARQRSASATAAYARYLDEIAARHPAFAVLMFPRVAVSDLEAFTDRFIVSYTVTDTTVCWSLIARGAVARGGCRPMPRASLNAEVAKFLRLLDEPGSGAALSSLLVTEPFSEIERMSAGSSGIPRVTVIPDDVLSRIPWEALRAPRGGYVGDAFVTSYAPSLTALLQSFRIQHPPASSRKALMVANVQDRPTVVPIHGTRVEFKALPREESARLSAVLQRRGYQVTSLEGASATPERLLAQPHTEYGIIHFDTHGFADVSDPLPSLILHPSERSPLGLLTLADIPKLGLRAGLVVISACQTNLGGAGDPVPGEGIESIARMFMIAGSKSVVASLWEVGTAPTVSLLERFYEEIGGGADRDVAMFRARAAARAKGFPYASNWAAFLVIGDPRN